MSQHALTILRFRMICPCLA